MTIFKIDPSKKSSEIMRPAKEVPAGFREAEGYEVELHYPFGHAGDCVSLTQIMHGGLRLDAENVSYAKIDG